MVAIVTAGGLGLERSSGSLLGSYGYFGSAALGRAADSVTVNAATGNLIIQNTDEILIGRGPDVIINRTYNSRGTYAGDTDNWLHNGQRKVVLGGTANSAGSTATLTDWDGSVVIFNFISTSVGYQATENPYRDDTLTIASNVFTWTEGKSRRVEKFDNANGGRITSAADADGNTITYDYTGSNLTKITTADNTSAAPVKNGFTTLAYTGNNLTSLVTSYYDVSTAANKTLTRTRYAYDPSNRLITVTIDLSPGDNVTKYTYVGTTGAAAKQVKTITQNDGTSLTITYDAAGKVSKFDMLSATGVTRTTSFVYDTTNAITTITDPMSNVSKMTYDTAGRLVKIEEPAAAVGGNPTITTYDYTATGDIARIMKFDTLADVGNASLAVEYQANLYDLLGNVVERVDGALNTIKWTYGAKNEVLTETRYTGIDPDGVGGVAPTGPMTTRYVYDAENHLRFKISAEGRVTEYLYDGSSQTAATTVNGVGQLTSMIDYNTVLYSLAGSTEAELMTWRSVANMPDKSNVLRTDTAYDFRGNVTTVTTFEKVDSNGNNSFGSGFGDASRTTYVYDQFGKLLSRLQSGTNALGGEAAPVAETFIYDGLGRVISAVDVYGVASTVAINDGTRITTVTTPNDVTVASTYNIAGEMISTVVSGTGIVTGTTSFVYDALGRLRVKTDAVGVNAYYLYDRQSRMTAQVDGDGSLTEYKYDAANRLIATVGYSVALNASQLTTLAGAMTNTEVASVRPTSTMADRWTWNVYDKAGKLIETINAAGAVVKFDYDGALRLTATTRYYNTLPSVEAYKVTPPIALVLPTALDSNDRATRNIYDNDGLLIATLDEDGYLTENIYDKVGRKTETIRYAVVAGNDLASALQPAFWRTATLAQLRIGATTAPAADIHNYSLYDGRGNVGASIDGEGNVTRYHYTARGDVDQEVRGQLVAANTAYTLATLPAASGTLEATRYYRNVAGQVTSRVRTLANGTETTAYTYDTRGRLTAQTVFENISSETRTERFRYDVKGRLIGSVGGIGSATLSASPTDTEVSNAINVYGIRYAYDVADRLISRIDPDGIGATGNKTLFYYDGDGQLRFQINALGEVTEYRYTVLEGRSDVIVYGARIVAGTLSTLTGGLLTTAVTNAVAAIANTTADSRTQYAYDNRGLLINEYSPFYVGSPTASNVRQLSYNSFGELSGVNSPTGTAAYDLDVSTVDYYRRGLQYTEYQALNGNGTGSIRLTHSYDAVGRKTADFFNNTDYRGNFYSYDRASRLTRHIDTSGGSRSTYYGYDARSNMIQQTDRNGKITSFSYDLFNRTTTTTTSEGVQSSVKKNAYGQTIQISDGAGRIKSYSYDKNGNLKTIYDANGKQVENIYDNADRLIDVIDAKGVGTHYTYDAVGRVLTRIEDYGAAVGKLNLTTTYAYDAKGQQMQVTDAGGIVTKFVYDLKGQKVQLIQDYGVGKLNIATLFTYRADGKVAAMTEGVVVNVATGIADVTKARTTSYDYDTMGRLTKKTEDQGNLNVITTYVWDENNNQIAISDALTRVTRFVYDSENRLQFRVNAEGEITENGYDNEGRIIWSRQYVARIAAATLSGFANKITAAQVTGNVAASASDRINRTLYDGDGRAAYAIDGEGYVTKTIYDGANNALKSLRYAAAVVIDNAATKTTLDALVPAGDPADAVITTYAYDGANRLTDITDATGSVTHFVLDEAGAIRSTTVAFGTADEAVTLRVFDALGRIVTEVQAHNTAEARYTYSAYDALGRLISVTDPRGWVNTRTFDNLGRMLTETVPLDALGNATTTYQYDTRGNRVKIIDPRGNSGYFYYDGIDRLIKQMDPEGYVTETAYAIGDAVSSVKRYYNRANNFTSVSVTVPPTVTIDAKDATTTFGRDKLDRVTSTTDAVGAIELNYYNSFGNRSQNTNKLGGAIQYYYDKRGILIYSSVNQNSFNSDGALISGYVLTTFNNDARGNVISQIVGSNLAPELRLTTTYAYDKLDRMIQKIDPTYQTSYTPITSYVYDRRGNIILITAPDGGKTYNYYDDNNRKIAEISASDTLTTWVFDSNNNIISRKIHSSYNIGSPPSGAGSFRETQFIYDRNNRLVQTNLSNLLTGVLNGLVYTTVTTPIIAINTNQYNANGNITREYDGNGNSVFHYYDRNGREIAKIDQNKYMTLFDRDNEGNIIRDWRLSAPIPDAVNVATSSDPYVLFAAYKNNLADRITDFVYDKNGRRVVEYRHNVDAATVSGLGGLSVGAPTVSTAQYAYNAVGSVTAKIEANGDTINYQYDLQGRLERQLDAVAADYNANGASSVRHATYFYYDSNNNVVHMVERAETSNSAAGGAGSVGNLASGYSSADNRITKINYVYGKLVSLQDVSSNYRYYYYDISGRITHDYYIRYNSDNQSLTDFEGTQTYYDIGGRVIEQFKASAMAAIGWTPTGPTTAYTYNAFGEVATKSVGGVVQERFDYDNAGRVIKSNSGDGVWKFYAYDANGNATLTLSSAGASDESATAYASAITSVVGSGALTSFNQTSFNATVTTYDKRNQATGTQEPNRIINAGAAVQIKRSRTYNAYGEVVSETDARGNVTDYTYNAMGRLIQKKGPTVKVTAENGVEDTAARPTENYFYDISGRLVATRDANGYTTTRTLLAGSGFDGTEAKVLKAFRPDGSVWETQFDAYGDARKLVDGLGRTTQQSFDKAGRVIQITKPSGFVDSYSYDILGQRLRHWNSFLKLPDNVTPDAETTDYDGQGRIIRQRGFGGDVTTMGYVWTGALATTGLGTVGGWITTTTFANAKTKVERKDSFGRLIEQTDLGGHTTAFGYDKAGRMIEYHDIASGASWSMAYYNTGHRKTVTNAGGVTTFANDADGNLVSERLVNGAVVLKDQSATFDGLGRVTAWSDVAATTPGASLDIHYDAVGNVRKRVTTYSSGAGSFTDWFAYDAMNRITIDKGMLSANQIMLDSNGVASAYQYNANGDRTQSRTKSTQFDVQLGYVPITQLTGYVYNVDGQLTSEARVSDYIESYFDPFDQYYISVLIIGGNTTTVNYTRDNMGRATNRAQLDHTDGLASTPPTNAYTSTASAYNAKSQMTQTITTPISGANITTTYSLTDTNGLYLLGQVGRIVAMQGGTTQTSDYSFTWFEGAIKTGATVTGTGAASPGTSTYTLDPFGLVSSAVTSGGSTSGTQSYVYDAASQGIARTETINGGTWMNRWTDNWYRMGGTNMWHYSNRYDPRIGDLDTSGSAYMVRSGDTVRSIAQAIWGDADLWYKLAEANGLSANASLTEGQRLTIPQGVWRNHQTASTYIPYDAGKFLQLNDPSPAYPAPVAAKSGGDCGAFGQILLVVIAVVVAVYAPQLIPAIAKLGAVGSVAASAAVGSVVSQGVGVATGIQDKFSFKAVALSALSAGVGAGVGQAVTALGKAGGALGKALSGTSFGARVVQGALGNAVTQGVSVATGLQKKFDWVGVAAAGVLNGVVSEVGKWAVKELKLDITRDAQGQFNNPLEGTAYTGLTGMAGAVAGAATRSLITGTDFGDNIIATLPDVIGSTIGNLVAGGVGKGVPRSGKDVNKSTTKAPGGSIIVNQSALSSAVRSSSIDAMRGLIGDDGVLQITGLDSTRMVLNGREQTVRASIAAQMQAADDAARSPSANNLPALDPMGKSNGFVRATMVRNPIYIAQLDDDYRTYQSAVSARPNAKNDPVIEDAFRYRRNFIGRLDAAVSAQMRADGVFLLKAEGAGLAVMTGVGAAYGAGSLLAAGGSLSFAQAAGTLVAVDYGVASARGAVDGSFNMRSTVGGTVLNPVTGGRGELAYGALNIAAAGVQGARAIATWRASVAAERGTPLMRGIAFENVGVTAARSEAFVAGQSVRRLAVRAFDDAGNLLPGRTVLDLAGNRTTGGLGALEFKLHEGVSLTARQAEHFPYLLKNGGQIVGNNGRAIGLFAKSPIGPLDVQRINGPTLPTTWWPK